MKQYLDLVNRILDEGTNKGDRTGTGTKSIFGHQMVFDLQKGFPLVTVKKTWWKGIVHELLWMISGSTNIKYLTDNNDHIWDEWADENGELGPVYGKQWREWVALNSAPVFKSKSITIEIDQLKEVVEQIKSNPNSRRHIVTAWNPGEVDEMKLPPCHMFYQFYVADGELSCQMYQRSADVFLGVPFNIASYALLTSLVAATCGLKPGKLVHTLGDAHIYNNHMDQVKEMLKRQHQCYILPTVSINAKSDIDLYTYEDIELLNYKHHPAIKAEVSV